MDEGDYAMGCGGSLEELVREYLNNWTFDTVTMVLLTIGLFCIGWLPLYVFYIATDANHPLNFIRTRTNYALCHMAEMVSSCCNPFLYGWLEPSFRAEFKEIFHQLKRSSPCSRFHRSRSSHSLDNSQPNYELMMHLQTKNVENDDQVQD